VVVNAGIRIDDLYVGSRDHCPARIGNSPGERCTGRLGAQNRWEHKDKEQKNQGFQQTCSRWNTTRQSSPGQAYCMNPPSPATWAESGNRAASQAPEHTYDTRRRSVPPSRAFFLKIPGRGKCWRTL
jgi:anti-sigma-K factor RskA